jgi:hypothetical protein
MDTDRIARSVTRNTLSGPGVFELELHTQENQFGLGLNPASEEMHTNNPLHRRGDQPLDF